ncbi:MAG: 50S ribosomal protein L29 [Candidatus Andersenbacteria bacterium]|nr:50S ribosomal protein L29 [bacterium]MDZ4225633.1 50S ribosomal protein L29 [Candidatus Andersenbacteria bacterium]
MKAHDFRNLNTDELAARIHTLKGDYFKKQIDIRSGKEKNHAILKVIRADIARAETVYQEQRRQVAKKD